ncbi:TRAP transporter substrate-binding protein DctP [Halomonas sp. MCCC 1A11036]|uniref:TRAP transporter substrate-binding protein DctP n=1 Tax=Billgrantia zhangzhouensis TaxID=2733481 RepID=A0ABS9AJM9_9GAMM|nr:TRAP transporter substrate-binding protein DctP [Halomonas zhangzhouensis]MCE8021960.1 TRAP transporter substrate-binding protein DctP [Halomonas zhangzhouensis]
MKMKHLASPACVGLFAIANAAVVQAQSFSFVHGSPEGHMLSRQGAEPWMECVREASEGDVDFSYYPSGQLSSTPELFRALQSRVADVTIIPIGYVSDELPLNGVSMLPGLGSSSKEIVAAYSEAVRDGVLADEFTAQDIMPLFVSVYPPYQMVSMRDKIESADDFRGKVVRSAGGAMNLAISELGASPAEIPIGDTYVALERGTADGTISGFASIKPFSLDEIMSSMSRNGEFGTFSNVFAMRLDDFDALSDELQQVFLDCGERVQEDMANYLDDEVEQLAQEFSEAGIEIYEFSPEALAEINERLEAANEVWVQRLERRGLPAQRVFDEYAVALADQ